jgi:DnaJ family protein A protein 2
MTENVDLYAILGVSKTCTMDELKKSYKKLCIQHHPDKGGDENEFKKISEAYNILKDPEKRDVYDKFGVDGLQNGMAQNVDVQSMMENLFGFGFGGKQSQNRPPPPQFISLRLSLEDIVNGNSNYVYILNRKIVDRTKERRECKLCQGKGFRVMARQMGFMQMQQQVECPQCKGAKYENMDELFQTIQEKITVPIPKNCSEQHKFVVRNKQDERLEGESGDVVLVIAFEEHPVFKRRNHDLFVEIKLTFVESMTGFTKQIELLDKTNMTISYPFLIRWQDILYIPQKGLYNSQQQKYGDLNILFKIDYPNPPILSMDTFQKLAAVQTTNRTVSPPELRTKTHDFFSEIPTTSPHPSNNHGEQAGHRNTQGIPTGMPFQVPGMPGGGPGQMECHQQ